MLNPAGLERYIHPELEKDRQIPALLEQFRTQVIDPFEEIIKHAPPEQWAEKFFLEIKRLRVKKLDPRIRKFLQHRLRDITRTLRYPLQEGSISKTAIHNVHDIAMNMKTPRYDRKLLHRIPLLDLPRYIPGMGIKIDGEITWLILYHDDQEVKIPLTRGVAHKGGPARLALKMCYKSQWLDPEFPLKDWDILVRDMEAGKNFMRLVGEKDLSGIEHYNSLFFVFSCRDVIMNECILSYEDGLIYTNDAMNAVISGLIWACGGDHGLYGKDRFVYQGHYFLKMRALERLFKFLMEEKADRFMIAEENLQLFMGVALVLAITRTIGKVDCFERLEKLYYLLDITGQLEMFQYVIKHRYGVECNNIFDLLEYVHIMYSFVSMENRGQDEGVARWLMKKLIKLTEKEFEEEYDVHATDLGWIKIDPKRTQKVFSLHDFHSDPEILKKMKEWFPGYLHRCRERNIESGRKD